MARISKVPACARAGFSLILVLWVGSLVTACSGGKSHPNRVSSITLSPLSAKIAVGQTQQFNGTATTNSGQTITGNNMGANWASSSTSVATVDPNGLATAVGVGTASISATVQTGGGPVTGTATLTVTPAALASITVGPSSPSITAGQTQQFTATGTYTDQSQQTLTTATWTSSSTSVATINTSGLATAVAAGTATITATSNGVSGTTTLTVTAAPPTVSIALSPSTVPPGSSSTLTWSSTGTTSCTASGAWSGSEPASGSQSVTQTAVGNYSYSLSCTGSGGTASKSSLLLVTNVKPSSYENKNDLNIGPISLSALNELNAFAVADFLNDGGETLVFHTLEYDPADPTTYSNYGHIHFYERSQGGTWVEKTSQLLSNTTGCLHPRKAVVADFNLDGRPDVFFACHGLDVAPFPGEQPHMLLSQPDGTYSNVTVPITCYCHGASAADVNGDGYPDILVTDTSVAQTPFFLMNNGDGTFAPDFNRLPASLINKQIFTAELVDFSGSGQYDVFLGGNEPGTTNSPGTEFAPAILPNDGNGAFVSTTPVSLLKGTSYGLALDIVFQNGFVYLLKYNSTYTGSEIEKISYPGLQESTIYTHSGAYPNGAAWLDWIIPYNGQLVSEDASYAVTVPE